MSRFRLFFVGAAIVASGCTTTSTPNDLGDGGARADGDSMVPDLGSDAGDSSLADVSDAGSEGDAGLEDAGSSDAGDGDTGSTDPWPPAATHDWSTCVPGTFERVAAASETLTELPLSFSADGRFLAFTSDKRLVPEDDGGGQDIYVYDRGRQSFELISVNAQAKSVGGSAPSVSRDARVVAFASIGAYDSGDQNNVYDVHVWDRRRGSVERIRPASKPEPNGHSLSPVLSADGAVLVFMSQASNLIELDDNEAADVFKVDLRDGRFELVSVDPSSQPLTKESYPAALSGDGRFAAFPGWLAGEDEANILVRDLVAHQTTVGGFGLGGAKPNASFNFPRLSYTGKFVAYISDASNLVEGDTNEFFDAFVANREEGTNERVNVGEDRAEDPSGISSRFAFSGDGRRAAFISQSPLVAGDDGETVDVFVRDLEKRTTTRLTAPGAALGVDYAQVEFSTDGRWLAFLTNARLAPGDTGNGLDLYIAHVCD